MKPDVTAENQGSISAEQQADLAALQGAANEVVDPVEQAAAAEAEQAGLQLSQEIAGLVQVFVEISKPVLPSLEKIYTPQATEAAANAIAALCRKHGWLESGLANGYAEEIGVAVVVLPLGFATYKGVQADLAHLKAEKKPEPSKPAVTAEKSTSEPDGPGSKTVVIGEPILEVNK